MTARRSDGRYSLRMVNIIIAAAACFAISVLMIIGLARAGESPWDGEEVRQRHHQRPPEGAPRKR